MRSSSCVSPYRVLFVCCLTTVILVVLVGLRNATQQSPATMYAVERAVPEQPRSAMNISSSPMNITRIAEQTELDAMIHSECHGTTVPLQHYNYKDPLSIKRIKYLKNYENPCWYEGKECRLKCLPYFMVIGLAKCGTTMLFETMKHHHQIEEANYKEIYWWTRLVKDKEKKLDWYSDVFSKPAKTIQRTVASTQNGSRVHPLVTYDSTPTTFHEYIGNDLSAKTIRHVLPNIKLLVILRHPTDMLYSFYNHFTHRSAKEFHEKMASAIAALRECYNTHSEASCVRGGGGIGLLSMGMYDRLAEQWLQVFTKRQIHFVQTEHYLRNPRENLKEIFAFLNLETMRKTFTENMNVYKPINQRKYMIGPMLNKTRTLLNELYKPHIKHLAQILNDDKFLW